MYLCLPSKTISSGNKGLLLLLHTPSLTPNQASGNPEVTQWIFGEWHPQMCFAIYQSHVSQIPSAALNNNRGWHTVATHKHLFKEWWYKWMTSEWANEVVRRAQKSFCLRYFLVKLEILNNVVCCIAISSPSQRPSPWRMKGKVTGSWVQSSLETGHWNLREKTMKTPGN